MAKGCTTHSYKGTISAPNLIKRKENGKVEDNKKLGNGVKLQLIRRITGYLVGTLDKWNAAKKAEEKDRVKHGVKKE